MPVYEKNHSGAGFLTRIRADNLTYRAHLHLSFEFVFCLEGEIIVTISGKEHLLKKNQGAVIPYNAIHSYFTPEHSVLYSILVGQGQLQDIANLFQQHLPARYTFEIDPVLCEMLLEHYSNKEKQTTFGAKAVLYRAFDAFMTDNTFQIRDAVDQSITAQLTEFIQEHFQEPVSLEDFARHIDYNYFYASKLIKRNLNLSFSQLLTEYRLAYAQELLQENQLSISQIALLSGFGSIRNFNRTFLKATGKTPREFLAARQ